MAQRLQACSYYSGFKRRKLYLQDEAEPGKNISNIQKFKNTGKNYFSKTKSGFFAGRILEGVYRLLYFPKYFPEIFHKRYCSNNNLGIYLTTSCNLSCFNCQTSARQAPANDIMTVGQMKKIVNEAIELEYYWNQINVTGGEPALHPQFFETLDVLKEYKDFNPECKIILETNGAGRKVQSVLEKLPGWISINNSNKKEKEESYLFFTYHIAPIDILTYRLFSDFSKGCARISICYGLCASMFGYYPCAPCMNVDRVFGFDIGIKKLSRVTEEALRGQMEILCKYCGWFKEQQGKVVLTEKMSPSWKKAFGDYRKLKPELSLY